ncbi:MAG TPA: DUF3301 domain-containing protein [Xanthobacteraceae bacterium]|nr:DUF3301 domain-containing protein [Xanthobacteraceae bacterium]
MFEPMLLLLLILAGAYAWQNALHARERARALCFDLCTQANVQLLDQTVALQRMRLIRVPQGWRLRRDYRFDFSVDGRDRHRGTLSLIAGELQTHSLPIVDVFAHEPLGNVVKFPVRPSLDKH